MRKAFLIRYGQERKHHDFTRDGTGKGIIGGGKHVADYDQW